DKSARAPDLLVNIANGPPQHQEVILRIVAQVRRNILVLPDLLCSRNQHDVVWPVRSGSTQRNPRLGENLEAVVGSVARGSGGLPSRLVDLALLQKARIWGRVARPGPFDSYVGTLDYESARVSS
ncbi:hypothetical protein BHM03_00061964, partial [Ensete ventricosum]